MIGLSAQPSKDWWIKTPAAINPVVTIISHSRRVCRLLVDIYDKPWIDEDSRNILRFSIFLR